MSVTTRIDVADELAATYSFTIEHDGRSVTLGPAEAHELASMIEADLRDLVAGLNIAERTEAGRLAKLAAPHPVQDNSVGEGPQHVDRKGGSGRP